MSYDKSEQTELDCTGFRARLDAVLDERDAPQLDLQLRAHARHCLKCADWLETQTAILETVEGAGSSERQVDLAVPVLQKFETARRERLRRLRRTVASVAVAASLLVAINVWRGPGVPDVQNNAVAMTPEIPAEVMERMGKVSEDIKPVSGSVYTALNAIWLAQQLL
jgi:hypothetical protein